MNKRNIDIINLKLISNQLREMILKKTSLDGGHVSSPLGVIEIIQALIQVFDFKRDKITFDVGHYTHAYKILTDRKEHFFSMDKRGGIGEYPNIFESPFDFYTVGHSGTAISAALGYSVNHNEYKTIAMIGDGSMTGGQPFEALNHAGELLSNVLIIYNDNGYSVTENVGFLNSKKRIRKFSESLGFKYIGILDGHNLGELISTFQKVKYQKFPIFIHVRTIKGKGYPKAENDPVKFHWLGAYDIQTGELVDNKENTFANYIINKTTELRKKYKNLYLTSPAASRSTGLYELNKTYPNFIFDTGMNEQHCVTFSSALALNKNKVICFIPATFLPRAIDQIIDVCQQNIPIIFVLLSTGIASTGPTHQGIYTFPLLNMIPNVHIFNPSNIVQFDQLLELSLGDNKVIFIQKPLENIEQYAIDDVIEFSQGNSLTVISIGNMLRKSLKLLKKIPDIQILYIHKIKPINFSLLKQFTKDTKNLLILEDGCISSGIGQHIIAMLLKNNHLNYEILGVTNEFPQLGTLDEVYTDYGLDDENILNVAKRLLYGK